MVVFTPNLTDFPVEDDLSGIFCERGSQVSRQTDSYLPCNTIDTVPGF